MVLTFKFSGKTRGMETIDWVEFRGAEIVVSTRPEPIARFHGTHWLYSGTACSYLECRHGLYLQFMDNLSVVGPALGPFTGVHLRGAYMFAGRQHAATLTLATTRWTRRGTTESWSVVRVVPQQGRQTLTERLA